MRVLISDFPAKMFDVLEHGVIDDPEMNFLLVSPADRRRYELEKRGLYRNTPVRVEPFSAIAADSHAITDSGYVYLESSLEFLRAWDNSKAIYIRLCLTSDTSVTIDAEIFPRQVGYGITNTWVDPNMDVAWILAVPSSVTPGELELCDDLIRSDFMLVMPG